MYKQPSYFEEEKIGIKNNKILIFCIVIAIVTIIMLILTGILAYKMIKSDSNSEQEEMVGAKTVGIGNQTLDQEEEEKIETNANEDNGIQEEDNANQDTNLKTENFPKHDIDVAMESQLPQYSEEIAQNVVNVYYEETKKIYLTFDDGPSALTQDILNILEQYNVKATFFVLGSNVDKRPEVVKKEYESGHFIASHGYSHVYSQIYSSPQSVLDEYNQSVTSIRNAIGVSTYNPHLFRFPGGSSGGTYASVKQEAIQLLKENNVTYTNWNCLTGDASGSTTIEEMWNELKSTSEGDDNLVILMHDAGDKELTVEFLPELIEYYQGEGYEFVNYYDVMCE